MQILDSLAAVRAERTPSGTMRLVAAEAFAAGEAVMELEGTVVAQPSRYTLQIGRQSHLAPRADGDDLWRFLNHSCRPNAWVNGGRLIALAPIAAGEEITFDYNCTEYEMAEPFGCRCGHCDGAEIRGFRHLNDDQRRARSGRIAAYLLH